MGEVIAIIVILLIAAAAFELAWRLAFVALLWGPPAYAGMAAAWYGARAGLEVWLALFLAVAAFLVVRQAIFLLFALAFRAFDCIGRSLWRLVVSPTDAPFTRPLSLRSPTAAGPEPSAP